MVEISVEAKFHYEAVSGEGRCAVYCFRSRVHGR